MIARFVSAVPRSLAWCFLAALCVASLEALAYYLVPDADTSLPFDVFFRYFSNSCAVLFAAALCLWLTLRVVVVWLGGVRPGHAMLFLFLFLLFFGYLMLLLDLVIIQTPRFGTDRVLLQRYFTLFACAGAALASMIAAKIAGRFRLPVPGMRAFTALVLLLSGAAFAVWARHGQWADVHGGLFWGIFLAGWAAAVVLLVLFAGTPGRLSLVAAVLAAAVFAPPALRNAPPAPMPEAAKAAADPAQPRAVRHVVLITLDTLRRDALGAHNPGSGLSPNIDALAAQGAVFENAFSPSPWTYPSVASLLTGLPPGVHGLTEAKNTLPKALPTMAEAFSKAGYRTAAVGFNYILLPRSGLNRGFDEYRFYPQPRLDAENFGHGPTRLLLTLGGERKPDAAALTNEAAQWLRENARRDFFLWVHYLDVHSPYAPPEEYLPGDAATRKEMGTSFGKVWSGRAGAAARTAKERAWVRALYDGEVRYTDAQVGRLLETMKRLGIYDDAIIAVTSDHGEEFWDHGGFEHGHTLYNELVRVPLIIKLPGNEKAASPAAPRVGVQALLPTVLELCGAAPAGVSTPFTPLLTGRGEHSDTPHFMGANVFNGPLEGVVFDNMKYIRDTLSGRDELYNLETDPGELNSIAGQDPVNVEKGRALLDGARAGDAQKKGQLGVGNDGTGNLNQEEMSALEALGYL